MVVPHLSMSTVGICLRHCRHLLRLQAESGHWSKLPRRGMADSALGRKLDLSGIFPPIATPFNSDQSLALDKLGENLKKWDNVPLAGYAVLGSNGEAPLLTFEEKLEVMQVARSNIPKSKLLIAGAGCESTQETIKLSHEFSKIGADAALVITPWYFKPKMNSVALSHHFRKVADEVDMPVIVYNCPIFTGVDMDAETIIGLASHPNIVAVKDNAGSIPKLTRIVAETTEEDFQVLAGSASFLLPALSAGCVGGICALANMLGQECFDLISLFKAGKLDEAWKLQARLITPNAVVTNQFGVPGLKHMLGVYGFYSGPVRSPLQELSEEQRLASEKEFRKHGFLR